MRTIDGIAATAVDDLVAAATGTVHNDAQAVADGAQRRVGDVFGRGRVLAAALARFSWAAHNAAPAAALLIADAVLGVDAARAREGAVAVAAENPRDAGQAFGRDVHQDGAVALENG